MRDAQYKISFVFNSALRWVFLCNAVGSIYLYLDKIQESICSFRRLLSVDTKQSNIVCFNLANTLCFPEEAHFYSFKQFFHHMMFRKPPLNLAVQRNYSTRPWEDHRVLITQVKYRVRSPKFIQPCTEQLYTHWLKPATHPSPPHRVWARIREQYWSAKIDDISL